MFGYDTTTLRDGATVAGQAADAWTSTADRLGGAVARASIFSEVAGAAGLAGAVQLARDHHCASARTRSSNAQTAVTRLHRTAELGDWLTTTTTRVASRQ